MTGGNLKALLIDLDGTLLEIDIEQFVPAYIAALSRRFASSTAPDDFARFLLGATRRMMENDDPELTNEAVFYADFCRRIGLSLEQIRPIVEHFYRVDFPALSHWGRPYPHARSVVEAARERGLRLVLATQPIFPRAAVEQRLAWGGLNPSDFDLITTIENMHFCKPKPAYYREIAAMIGCVPEQCLMAGNDVQEDLCAADVGMDTFLVEGLVLDRGAPAVINRRGSLQDLAELIKKGI